MAKNCSVPRFGASWSPDGKWLAAIKSDGTAEIRDSVSGRPLHRLLGHHSVVTSLSWAPGGRLVTMSLDGTAKIWDPRDGKEIASLDLSWLDDYPGGVSCASWSPDCRRLAIGTVYGVVRVWDVASAREQLVFHVHKRKIESLCWSSDGKRLAAADGEAANGGRVLKVWETTSGRELLTFRGNLADWSSDGTQLAIASSEDRLGMVTLRMAASAAEIAAWSREERAQQEPLVDQGFALPRGEGYIKSWLLLLPISLDEGETTLHGLERQQLADEAQIRPRPGKREAVGARELVWQEHRSPYASLGFRVLAGQEGLVGRESVLSVAYAVCYLETEHPGKELRFQLSIDEVGKLYLNGIVVYIKPAPTYSNRPETIGPVTLKQGTNVLVFKVVSGWGPWQGWARLVDETGQSAQGIRLKLTPEP